jgi:hypothetical protein
MTEALVIPLRSLCVLNASAVNEIFSQALDLSINS